MKSLVIVQERSKMATRVAPLSLKSIQPYLQLAKKYESIDPVVSVYVYFHAVNVGIGLAKGDKDSKGFLASVMDTIERLKLLNKHSSDEDCFGETVGQSHVEAEALKIFLSADGNDRAGNFNKDVVKQFYSSNLLFAALSQFGDVSEDILEKHSYAKYKATEINRCLKNGITPTPGPPGGDNFDINLPVPAPASNIGFGGYTDPSSTPSQHPVYPEGGVYSYAPPQAPPPGSVAVYPPADHNPVPKPRSSVPPPQDNQSLNPAPPTPVPPPAVATGVHPGLTFKEYSKASKYCRHASSALDYEDATTAIDNLTKALHLLRTGRDQ